MGALLVLHLTITGVLLALVLLVIVVQAAAALVRRERVGERAGVAERASASTARTSRPEPSAA